MHLAPFCAITLFKVFIAREPQGSIAQVITRCPSSIVDVHIFDFSETTEENLTKLHSNQILNVPYQVCGFFADRNTKMATLAYEMLRHF